MAFKRFLSVFTTAMFAILVVAGFVAVILINVKQDKSNVDPTDNNSNTTNTTPKENPDWTDKYIEPKQKPFNTLVFVTDPRGKDTDTIVLVNFDPEEGVFKALSIPRDTILNNNQKAIRIYESSANEILKDEKVISLFEDLLNTEIKYTAKFSLGAIERAVEELGGLYFHIPADMYYYDNGVDPETGEYNTDLEILIDLKKGDKQLSGKDTVNLLRFRRPSEGHESEELSQFYPSGSDMDRINMGKSVLKTFVQQLFEMSRRNLVSKLSNLVNILYDQVEVHMTLRDLQELVNVFLKAIPVDKNDNYELQDIEWFVLPGQYSNDSYGYVYRLDIPATSTIINENFSTK